MNWNPFQRKPKSAGTKLPAFLPILEEIVRAWEAVTQEEIDRSSSRLKPVAEGDTTLGVLHAQEVRRTWALSEIMAMRCKEMALHAESKAQGEEERRWYIEGAARFDIMDDCLRQMFWAQAKDDIGGKAWENGSVGIRSGWMLVRFKQRTMPDFMEVFGGGFKRGE